VLYIISSSHFIQIIFLLLQIVVVLSLPSPTVAGSILAKLAWLVAATYYHFPCPLRLTPVTGVG